MQSEKPPCILIQNNKLAHLYQYVAKFGHENNIEVIDRSMTIDFDINNCGVDWSKYGPVLVYGSTDFIAACSKSEHVAKYIYNDREAFAMSNLVKDCSRIMFNHQGAPLKLDFTRAWMKDWPIDKEVFIRPDLGHKSFNGGVYNLKKWKATVKERNLPDDLVCWMSDVKDPPAKEYRLWMVGDRIGAVSQYMDNGKQSVKTLNKEEVEGFFYRSYPLIAIIRDALKDTLPPCFAIDFAIPKGRGWSSLTVLELNCINSSGFYGLDNITSILATWMDHLLEKNHVN